MIRRLTLRNVMSHEETVLDLAPGLNVITGANNIGKSAVYQALRVLARGGRGSDFIVRHGAREAEVIVETDDGHTIVWRRKRSGAIAYTLDGREFGRAGGAVPEEVVAALRLDDVTLGEGGSIDVHLANQKEPLFLLGATTADVARFFAESSDAHLLLRMRKLHTERTRDARAELKHVEGERADLERRLGALEPLDPLRARIGDAGEARRDIERRRARRQRLTDAHTAIVASEATLARHRARARALSSLGTPPSIQSTAPLRSLLGRLTAAAHDHAHSVARRARLAPLRATLPDIAPTVRLAELAARTRGAARDLAALHRRRAALATLPSAPALESSATLATRLAGLAAQAAALAQSRADHAAAVAAARAAESELEAWMRANRRCPLCGAELSAAQTHTHQTEN